MMSGAAALAISSAALANSNAALAKARKAECELILEEGNIRTIEKKQEYAACVEILHPKEGIYEIQGISYAASAVLILFLALFFWFKIKEREDFVWSLMSALLFTLIIPCLLGIFVFIVSLIFMGA